MLLLDPRIVQRRVAKINRMKAASKVRHDQWQKENTDRYVSHRRQRYLRVKRVVECEPHQWSYTLMPICRHCKVDKMDWAMNARKYRLECKYGL